MNIEKNAFRDIYHLSHEFPIAAVVMQPSTWGSATSATDWCSIASYYNGAALAAAEFEDRDDYRDLANIASQHALDASIDNMDTLNRLADIAVEIDELKSALSPAAQSALLTLAGALHDIVVVESGDHADDLYGDPADDIYAPEDKPA